MPKPTKTLEQRFWEKVDKTPGHGPKGDCWAWIAGKGPRSSYGRIGASRKMYLAHRVAFFLHHGRWPTGDALHRCDNTACVNPDHLFEGSQADNNADRDAKGRQQRGERHYRSKLTPAQIHEIFALRATGLFQWQIGERYGIHQSLVHYILSGKVWSHIQIIPELTPKIRRYITKTQVIGDIK